MSASEHARVPAVSCYLAPVQPSLLCAEVTQDRKKTQMAMGRAMGPEQPDSQTAGPAGLGDPSKTVPEEVLKLWASLPRRERHTKTTTRGLLT